MRPVAARLTLPAIVAAALLGCAFARPAPAQDWMRAIALHESSAPVRPSDGALVEQTPPDFGWPDLGPGTHYRVTLTYPDGSEASRDTPYNWLNWDQVLPAGTFAWQVEATDEAGTHTGLSRTFTVAATARPFVVPAAGTLIQRAVAKAHPRALPPPDVGQRMIEQRGAGLDRLFDLVAAAGAPEEPEPTAELETAIEAQAFPALDRTMNALVAYIATGDDQYYAQALQRSLAIAAWDPRGRTSYATADQVARGVAGTLALAYDWLFPRLNEVQKGQLLAVLEIRMVDMYADLVGERSRIAVHPYDSHGHHTLTFLALMATLLAGELPEAEAWLAGSLPLALNTTSPWGGEDGGFGGGTAYAQWVTGDMLLAWYLLQWTVGVDVAEKAWTRNYSRFISYFLPPGTPTGAFGDGAELQLDEQWARFGKAVVLFAPTAIGTWYAGQLTGEDPARLHLLLAPPGNEAAAVLPADAPSSALFPSIGWAALHSDLTDRGRTSIYFKSSPYGSFNHSHADQNGFVINAGGRALAIDSGYFDGYGTEHWHAWYKQSRAHNVVTFDGGQGQVVFEQSGQVGAGAITQFEDRPLYSIVGGDATEAYAGALARARRSLVYLRPDLVLVYDDLASDVARRWEWNIHALNEIQPQGLGRVAILDGDQSLCATLLAGPPGVFEQRSGFAVPPAGSHLPQWHGTYVVAEPAITAEFIVLLSVDCRPTVPVVARTGARWDIEIEGFGVAFENGVAQVREP